MKGTGRLYAVKIEKIKKACRKLLYYLLAAGYIIGNLVIPSVTARATNCRDVHFVFARGSGESLNGPSYNAWRQAIEQRLQKLPLSYTFYELGSAKQDGHQYPAVSVSGDISGITNLAGAAISGGELFKFGKSVDEGEEELKAYVTSISRSCPNTKFVLGGYSQGAMLVSRTINALDSSKIIYVTTFGDPKLYLPEGERRLFKKPAACYGQNLSNYRLNVSDCYAYEGVLGSYRPYQTSSYVDKIGTWCNNGDIMCSSRISINDHTAYVSKNLYTEAASVVVAKIISHYGFYETTEPNAMHDVAILVDNTGSMDGQHQEYRESVADLASRVVGSGGRIALYEFGDLAENVKTLERCGFGCSVQEIMNNYDKIGTRGGGDNPESVLSGLMTVMNSAKWDNGATKSIVLLTDNGYHNPDIDGTTLQAVVRRSLEIDPVNVYVLKYSGINDTYAELTTQTNGSVIERGAGDIGDIWEKVITRPTAKLKMMEYQAEVGSTLSFDASGSYAENGGNLTFDWDLDGDGIFEYIDAGGMISKAYNQSFDGYIQVKVTDQNGISATMSAHVCISEAEQSKPLAKITSLSNNEKAGQNEFTFTTTGTKVLLATEDTPLGWTELNNGSGKFSIRQLREDAKFYLIPYSKSGTRGERYEFALSGREELSMTTDTSSKKTAQALPKVPNAGVYASDR